MNCPSQSNILRLLQQLLTPPIGESTAINGLALKKLTYNHNVLIKMINYTNSLQRTSSKNLSIFNVA
jgi:mevalonate kinase